MRENLPASLAEVEVEVEVEVVEVSLLEPLLVSNANCIIVAIQILVAVGITVIGSR